MVLFFVQYKWRKTLTSFLSTWAARLGSSVQVAHYEDVPEWSTIPPAATYVFTDLERLSPSRLEQAAALADSLAAAPGNPIVLNHPRRALRRYELLRMLHDRGVNPFRAYRVLETRVPERFPVFLRFENRHDGPASPLLWTPRELDRAVANRFSSNDDLSSLLMIEYHDVSDDSGTFHRHVTYVIGDELIHGNLAFDTNWVVKYGGPATGEQLEAQRAAWGSTAHIPLLRDIADRAGIGYGRFDYSIVNDTICVWELNTAPTLLLHPDEYPPDVRVRRKQLGDRLTNALEQLASGPNVGPIALTVTKEVSKEVQRRRVRGKRVRALRWRVVSTLVAHMPPGIAGILARRLHLLRARRSA